MIEKKPSDGLCGQTDEDKFGFSYEVLDRYIRTGECDDPEIKAKIDERHKSNLFKLSPMPEFEWYCEKN
jgi:NAD+ synthase